MFDCWKTFSLEITNSHKKIYCTFSFATYLIFKIFCVCLLKKRFHLKLLTAEKKCWNLFYLGYVSLNLMINNNDLRPCCVQAQYAEYFQVLNKHWTNLALSLNQTVYFGPLCIWVSHTCGSHRSNIAHGRWRFLRGGDSKGRFLVGPLFAHQFFINFPFKFVWFTYRLQ